MFDPRELFDWAGIHADTLSSFQCYNEVLAHQNAPAFPLVGCNILLHNNASSLRSDIKKMVITHFLFSEDIDCLIFY